MVVSGKNNELILKSGLILSLLLLALPLKSQENNDIAFDDAAFKIGIHASANGYGIFYRNVMPVKPALSRVVDISFTSIKHYKEKSILNQRIVNTSPYTFGKINRLYALRPMIGFQKTLAEKSSKNSVGVNAFAALGPTLGFLKPIYVNIEMPDPNNPNVYISVPVRYTPETIHPNKVIGNAPFFTGIGETKFVLGTSFKAGVEFNWGYYSSEFKSIEVGVLIDYFPGRPDILYNIKNKTVYSSFYVSFAFGKNY